jgi:hypothetical protein
VELSLSGKEKEKTIKRYLIMQKGKLGTTNIA